MEYKSISMEVQDLDLKSGEALIRHAVYDNIDYVRDISRKGMFNKSWNETKMADGLYDIDVYLNHDPNQAWAKTIGVKEVGDGAVTHVKAGKHTLGTDVMLMLDDKIARKASFGFITMKSNQLQNNIRELKEVSHLETSVLTKLAANKKAGVIASKKSFDASVELKTLTDTEMNFLSSFIQDELKDIQQLSNFAMTLDPTSDLYTSIQYWIGSINSGIQDMKYAYKWNRPITQKSLTLDQETKDHIENLRKFVRNSRASDNTLAELEAEIKSFDSLLNTADTGLISQPFVSEQKSNDEFANALHLLTLKHF